MERERGEAGKGDLGFGGRRQTKYRLVEDPDQVTDHWDPLLEDLT